MSKSGGGGPSGPSGGGGAKGPATPSTTPSTIPSTTRSAAATPSAPKAPAQRPAAAQPQRSPAAPAQKAPTTQAQAQKAPAAHPQKGASGPAQKAPATQAQKAPSEPAKTAPKYNPIEAGPTVHKVVNGTPYKTQSSTMTYSQATMQNSRNTPEGKRADAATRKHSGAGDGRDAGHRHSTSGGANPGDRSNVYRQNSIQNRAGGTKRYSEQMRDQAVKKDPSYSVQERSTLVYSPTRAGYGNKTPTSENVKHTQMKDGKVVGTSEVAYGQFKGSAERAADKAAAQGKTISSAEQQRLHAQDRKNFGATTKQDQARAAQLKADGGPGSAPDRASMARIMAQQAPNSNVHSIRSPQKQGPTPKLP